MCKDVSIFFIRFHHRWDPDNTVAAPVDGEGESAVIVGKKVKPSHRLLVKTAVLMPAAKEGEVTMVQVESEGYNGSQVCSMSSSW